MNRKQFLVKEIEKVEDSLNVLPFRFEIVKEGKKDVREGIRQEYDRIKELVDAANVRLKTENSKNEQNRDKTVIDNLTKMKDKYSIDMGEMEKQIKELDKELDDVDKTLNVRIEAGRAYINLVKKLLKK